MRVRLKEVMENRHLKEVYKRQNKLRGLFHGNTEAALQLVRGNDCISLSSVHKKVVST